jgi:hypothetical protein
VPGAIEYAAHDGFAVIVAGAAVDDRFSESQLGCPGG